jgi:hypothetical protein
VRNHRISDKNLRDLPNQEERNLYKKQLKNWLNKKVIIDPEKFEDEKS